jgi:hypothetical protein
VRTGDRIGESGCPLARGHPTALGSRAEPVVRDAVLLGVMVLAFATFVTSHLTLVIGLSRRPSRWRSVVALVVLPLAPVWGFTSGMAIRASLWVVSAIAYVVARAMEH